jgi:hypothetical protein
MYQKNYQNLIIENLVQKIVYRKPFTKIRLPIFYYWYFTIDFPCIFPCSSYKHPKESFQQSNHLQVKSSMISSSYKHPNESF